MVSAAVAHVVLAVAALLTRAGWSRARRNPGTIVAWCGS